MLRGYGEQLRHRWNAALAALAALFVVTAYVAALVALALWLAPRFGASGAAGIIAAAALVLALVLLARDPPARQPAPAASG